MSRLDFESPAMGFHLASLPDHSLRVYNAHSLDDQKGILLTKLEIMDECLHVKGVKGQVRRNMFMSKRYPYVKVFEQLEDGYYDIEINERHFRFTLSDNVWTMEESLAKVG